jgi:disulfide bond formation protein DsbB
MSTRSFSLFFALLTFACWAAIAAIAVLFLARRRDPDGAAAQIYDDIAQVALPLAALVACVTMAGSLYYSQIAHFVPCALCWYQRIAAYPLAVILVVASFRRDGNVWWYVVPQAVIGAGFAVYHAQLQAFPHQHSSFCTISEPCTIRYVWEFGFVSLPLMALTAFAFIIVFVLVARSLGQASEHKNGVPPTQAPAPVQ